MSNAIATNAAANSAVSFLSRNSEMQSSSIAKLSSGSRIVKASDDAASLAVGTKLKADVTALKQASANADQAASLMQVADGAISRVSDTLMRMKSLATQARSDVLTEHRARLPQRRISGDGSQIDFIASSTKFNDTSVADGALGSDVDLGSNSACRSGLAGDGGLRRSSTADGGFLLDLLSPGFDTTTVDSTDCSLRQLIRRRHRHKRPPTTQIDRPPPQVTAFNPRKPR